MIELKRVTKTYETPSGAIRAIRDLDLEIGRGEFVAVVGRSGSGKSTLLHLIAGIDRPTSGVVAIEGSEIQGWSERQLSRWRGKTVGVVFQFFQLLPTLTAAENVMLPMDFRRVVPRKERRNRALSLLEIVGVAGEADRPPSELSGGQQQRVAIARALANDPPVIVADEPTGNLDSETARSVLDLMQRLAGRGITVVLATHERELAGRIDRTISIADGAIVSAGKAG